MTILLISVMQETFTKIGNSTRVKLLSIFFLAFAMNVGFLWFAVMHNKLHIYWKKSERRLE